MISDEQLGFYMVWLFWHCLYKVYYILLKRHLHRQNDRPFAYFEANRTYSRILAFEYLYVQSSAAENSMSESAVSL